MKHIFSDFTCFIDNKNEYEWIDRNEFIQMIANRFTEQIPPIILWNMGNYIEAIFYTDHFFDLKSQVMLRFLADNFLKFVL